MAKIKPGTARSHPPEEEPPHEKVKPAMEIRIGRIKAAIWLSHTESGQYDSVTLSRLYKEDDHGHQSQTFGRDDLLVLAKVADLAHSWIVNETQSEIPS
jgi:hypothetical protein